MSPHTMRIGAERLFGWTLTLAIVLAIAPVTAMSEPPSPEERNYGFFMLRFAEELEGLPPLNVSWVRLGGVALWNLVEPNPGSGIYDFSKPDQIVQEANDLSLQIVLSISQRNDGDPGASVKALPTNMKAYKAFVRACVERYDGDGIDDASEAPVVRYWQVGNEPDYVDENGVPTEWNDTPDNFAFFLKESSEAIRLANPTAVTLLAGMAQGLRGLRDFYDPMLTALEGYSGAPHFDVFDVHWFGLAATNDYVSLDAVAASINETLAAHNYAGIPIWVTETATYSGAPEGFVTQTEEEQSRDLAKRLMHFRGLGMQKVFWTPLTEYHNWKDDPNCYFDNAGLINNPLNDGDSSKKKAYYTYRFLASKLDGATVQTDSPFMRVIAASVFQGCEFALDGRSYYGLWLDDPDLAGAQISYPTEYDTFIVYTLAPDANGDIPVQIIETVNGRFEYTAGIDPILIEYCGDGNDLDGDGQLTPGDALLAFQHYLGMTQLTECGQQHADVDEDSTVTPGDALCIFQCYLGIPCEHLCP